MDDKNEIVSFRLRLFEPSNGQLVRTVFDNPGSLGLIRDGSPQYDAFLDIIWRGAVVFTETRRSAAYAENERGDTQDIVVRVVPGLG